jgi:hypothetical protein
MGNPSTLYLIFPALCLAVGWLALARGRMIGSGITTYRAAVARMNAVSWTD